jgi:hypothetical protein
MLTERPIAVTSFMSGPNDDLIVADVYEKQDDNVINKFPDLVVPSIDQNLLAAQDKIIADYFRGVMSKGIPNLAKGSDSSFLSKAKDLYKQGTDALGGASNIANVYKAVTQPGSSVLQRLATGAMTGIPGLQGSLTSSLSSMLGNTSGGLSSVLGKPLASGLGTFITSSGITSKIDPKNVLSTYQMSGLINNLTGVNSISINDKTSATSLIGNLAGNAVRSGIPNALSSLQSLAGSNPDILIGASKQVMDAVKSTGSLAGLHDVANTIGSSNVYNADNNVLHTVARNYTAPSNYTTADLLSEYSTTKSTFSTVNPSWNSKTIRVQTLDEAGYPLYDPQGNELYHEETRIDLSVVQSGSPDFLSMIEKGSKSSSDPIDKYFNLSSAFPATSPEASLAEKYPTTVTSIASDTNLGDLTLSKPKFDATLGTSYRTAAMVTAEAKRGYSSNGIIWSANDDKPGLPKEAYSSENAYLQANTIIR